MNGLLLLPLSMLTILSACGAQGDTPCNTNAVAGQAVALVGQIARDIEAIRPQFAELSYFSVSNHLARARIAYRHNADYVHGGSKGHYNVRRGGCIIEVEAWETSHEGWPGMEGGADTQSIVRTLPSGVRIMASVRSPNFKLRSLLADAIDARLKAAK